MNRTVRNEDNCHYTNGHRNDLDRITGKLYMHEFGKKPLSESQIMDLIKEGDELSNTYFEKWREKSGDSRSSLYLESSAIYEFRKKRVLKSMGYTESGERFEIVA